MTKNYYHEIPHMADDDLDPYSYRLYGHFRRYIGNNRDYCPQSIRELAQACQMSTGKVSAARRDLERRGLITVEHIKGPGDSITGSRVRLVDIWDQNAARYGEQSADPQAAAERRSPGEHPHSPHKHPRSPDEHPRSPGERFIKNKKNQKHFPQKRLCHHQHHETPAWSDEEQDIIQDQIKVWGVAPRVQQWLRQYEPETALALIWQVQSYAKTNPAGLLATMLSSNQQPDEAARDLARFALEQGISSQQEAQQADDRRALLEWWEEYEAEHQQRSHEVYVSNLPLFRGPATADDPPPEPATPVVTEAQAQALDKAVSGDLTWRHMWDAVLGHLRVSISQPTFNLWLKESEPVGFDAASRTLIVQTRSSNGPQFLARGLGSAIDEMLTKYAKQPATVRYVAESQPALVRQESDGVPCPV